MIPKSALAEALKPPQDVQQPLMCFQRNRNLSDRLVRARLPQSVTPPKSTDQITLPRAPSFVQYNTPCSTPLCRCCVQMSRLEVVHSGPKFYHLAKGTSCNSCSLVYLLECSKCESRNRYMGQTARTLATRLAGHRRDFVGGKEMPLYRHLKKPRPHLRRPACHGATNGSPSYPTWLIDI